MARIGGHAAGGPAVTRALWRLVPGPAWLRALLMLGLVALLLVVCFELVFPLVSRSLPLNEQTIHGP